MRRTKLINLKVTEDEYLSIQKSAVVHAGGNVSFWLRSRGAVDVDDNDPRLIEWRENQTDDSESDPDDAA
jgi:hypothetical protein